MTSWIVKKTWQRKTAVFWKFPCILEYIKIKHVLNLFNMSSMSGQIMKSSCSIGVCTKSSSGSHTNNTPNSHVAGRSDRFFEPFVSRKMWTSYLQIPRWFSSVSWGWILVNSIHPQFAIFYLYFTCPPQLLANIPLSFSSTCCPFRMMGLGVPVIHLKRSLL
jgi:hypothetical protein